jgi:hypothetical protein
MPTKQAIRTSMYKSTEEFQRMMEKVKPVHKPKKRKAKSKEEKASAPRFAESIDNSQRSAVTSSCI